MMHEWLWKISLIPIFFHTSQALTCSKFQSSLGVRTAVWCMSQTEQNLQPAEKTVHRKTHGAVEQDIHWSGFRTNTSQKILVQLQSLALETPTVEFPSNELKD